MRRRGLKARPPTQWWTHRCRARARSKTEDLASSIKVKLTTIHYARQGERDIAGLRDLLQN
jgi:hypothetical protein